MKFFVTGVNGQLGHDVMNELSKRGYDGIGSDLAGGYAGVMDDSAVTAMPYRQGNWVKTFNCQDTNISTYSRTVFLNQV